MRLRKSGGGARCHLAWFSLLQNFSEAFCTKLNVSAQGMHFVSFNTIQNSHCNSILEIDFNFVGAQKIGGDIVHILQNKRAALANRHNCTWLDEVAIPMFRVFCSCGFGQTLPATFSRPGNGNVAEPFSAALSSLLHECLLLWRGVWDVSVTFLVCLLRRTRKRRALPDLGCVPYSQSPSFFRRLCDTLIRVQRTVTTMCR